MKIKVAQGIRVCHDGKVYADGATAEVPDLVAAEWVRSGWVEPVEASSKRAKAGEHAAPPPADDDE